MLSSLTEDHQQQDFHSYIKRVKEINLHPRQVSILDIYTSVKTMAHLNHLIFYGPPGIGKYSQALHFLSKFSPTELKYEKRLAIRDDNSKIQGYKIKMSDIHYEIDMAQLGCAAKTLWHAIYNQITEIISLRQNKVAFILCRNFHEIHGELLDMFYSYLQHKCQSYITIKFIFLTETLSFFPEPILNCSDVISFGRPSKISYLRILKNNSNSFASLYSNLDTGTICNIKMTQIALENNKNKEGQDEYKLLQQPYKATCALLCTYFDKSTMPAILEIRNVLYELLIYNINISHVVWELLTYVSSKTNDKDNQIINTGLQFFELYNNNYRPIYHLELLFFKLYKIIWESPV